MAKHKVICDGDWFEILETEAPENTTHEQILRLTAQDILDNLGHDCCIADDKIEGQHTPNPSLTIRNKDHGETLCKLIIPMED